MSRLPSRPMLVGAAALLVSLLVATSLWTPGQASSSTRSDPLTAAWEHAQAAGSYQFSSDVEQITTPALSVLNVGRSSHTDRFYMEGRADAQTSSMEFRLWSDGGSILQEGDSVAVRVADGKTYLQRNSGEWQEGDDFTQTIAPDGDFMSYLVAAREVTDLGQDTRAGLTFTRYAFAIDGPTFALSVRDQMEAAMRQKGDVPPGVTFEVPAYYNEMIGGGELWVGEDGLPVRQILDLHFPEDHGESVSARITVNYSQFEPVKAASGGFLAQTGAPSINVERHLPYAGNLLALLAATVLSFVLIAYRHARLLARAVSVAVITSLLIGPILSNLRITDFVDKQTARAAVQEKTRDKDVLLRELTAEMNASTFDPHQSKLALAPISSVVANQKRSIAAAPFVAVATQAIPVTDDGTDTDGDGLTDFTELRIGTSEVLSDTDGDLLSDLVEVTGFQFNGERWYSDPSEMDSNLDSISDVVEWDVSGDGQPDDIDGDGVPDLFDEDNDGDHVPDRLDLAPFTQIGAGTPFAEANPLDLTVQNLTPNMTTFVDIQVRPRDEDRLWFALNPMDWPRDDQAQIRDVDGSVDDLQLVPMLEIRIPTASTFLPPASDLAAYGIVVSDLAENSDEKVAYVPLTLVTDQKTGERVAFNGRMPYLPQTSWTTPHQVRMLWAVQVLNDIVCDPDDPAQLAEGCNPQGYFYNQPQIVHRYYDEWVLTGLKINEEHGTDLAIIHDTPVYPDLDGDDALNYLSYVLDQRFLSVTDTDGDNQRDLDLAEIERRFDRGTNAGVTSSERFAIANTLNVKTTSYATFEEAIARTADITDTAGSAYQVLSTFDSVWHEDPNVRPLLMYAYESRFRGIGLDAEWLANGSVTRNGNQLEIDLSSSGPGGVTPIDTMAGLKLMPYCGDGLGEPNWVPCTPEDYWIELEARHGDQYLDPEDPSRSVPTLDSSIADGEMIVTQLYALTLMQGINNVVEHAFASNDIRLVYAQQPLDSDSELEEYIRNAALVVRTGAKKAANRQVFNALRSGTVGGIPTKSAGIYKALANANPLAKHVTRPATRTIANFKQAPLRATALVAGMLVAAVGFLLLADIAQENYELGVAVAAVALGITAYVTVVNPVLTAYNIAQALPGLAVNGMRSVLSMRSVAIGMSSKALAIGAVVAIAVTWGFFIYSIVSNDIQAFSPEFNRALADTIATTIYILVLAAISATVIGLIFVGIVGLIDLLLTALCELDVGEDVDNDGVPDDLEFNGGCLTIQATATKALSSTLYAYDAMVDTARGIL